MALNRKMLGLDSALHQVTRSIEKLEDEMSEGRTSKFCGTAFVSFNTEFEKNEVLKEFEYTGDDSLLTFFLGLKYTPEPS